MSKKLTPKDTFGALVTGTGNFRQDKVKQLLGGVHADPDTPRSIKEWSEYYKNMKIPKLDIVTFGEYFTHCCQLNSVLKKGEIITTHTDVYGKPVNFQIVMKDRLGFRACRDGKPYGNAKYATDAQNFGFIHPHHKALICKKDRREIFQDFLDLKTGVEERLNALKENAIHMIDEDVQISDVFDVKYGKPDNSGYSMKSIGYVQMNHRNISRDDLYITISCGDFNANNDFSASKRVNLTDYQGVRDNVEKMNIIVGFKEQIPVTETDIDGNTVESSKTKGVPLVTCNINSSRWEQFCLSIHDHDFTGIDINKIHTSITGELKAISDWFDDQLLSLRDKYSAEYVMWELVNNEDDCAI